MNGGGDILLVKDLSNGEKFKFNDRVWTLVKKIPRHEDVWDCLDDGGRHRPFRGDVDVEPAQRRLSM